MVVQTHAAERMKSREGLLKSFGEEGESDLQAVSPTSDSDGNGAEDVNEGLHRATSVNLGKGHARHISAGSARLLSLSSRSSVEAKRTSMSRSPRVE